MAAHPDPPAPDRLRSPADAFALFRPLLAVASFERVAAAYLAGEALLGVVDVACGDAVSTGLPMVSVLREALLRGADAVLLAHNHPGGDPAPSAEDLLVTRRFASAAAAIGICLIDHVVIAQDGCLSLRLLGLL